MLFLKRSNSLINEDVKQHAIQELVKKHNINITVDPVERVIKSYNIYTKKLVKTTAEDLELHSLKYKSVLNELTNSFIKKERVEYYIKNPQEFNNRLSISDKIEAYADIFKFNPDKPELKEAACAFAKKIHHLFPKFKPSEEFLTFRKTL